MRAERFTSTEQKTAIAITTRDGDDLTRQGRYSLSSILENVPGVTGGAAENANGAITGGTDNPAAGLTIRGIQSNVGTGGSVTSTSSSAAIYVDGVYNGIGSTYDISQVEVLRGPQGTLYGRSATSGVVVINTRNPDLNHYGADGLVNVGSYDMVQASAAVNIPIIDDKLAVRISGNHYERDGYDAALGGRVQTDDARIKLLYKPTETFSALLGAALQYNKVNSGGTAYDQTSPGVFEKNDNAQATDIGTGKNHFFQFWGEFNLDLGAVNLTYLPAYKTWNQNTLGVSRGTAPEFNQYINTPVDNFLTQELRLSSDNDSKLKWQGGLFYYYNNLRNTNELAVYPTDSLVYRSETHKRTQNIGAFGEATYSFTDTTRVTAGLRYDYTRVRNEQVYTVPNDTGDGVLVGTLSGDEGLKTFKNVTYKARIEHDLSPVNLLYASISTGFSPGDVAITTNEEHKPETVVLDDQTLTSYEIGSKNRFLGNRLQVNAALYYNNYGGFQTAGINTTPNDPANATFNTIVAPVKVYGAELEIIAKPWHNGQVGVNAAYTHARYDGIPEEYAFLFSTNKIDGVAPVQATAWVEQRTDLTDNVTLTGRAEGIYRSAFNAARITVAEAALGAEAFVRNSDTFIANLSATLAFKDSGLAITGYVRNVGDVRYLTNPGIRDVGTTGFTSSSVVRSDPRTWGVSVTARF
ncbi:putative outer membrane salicin receptor [Novosphingobium sp. Rr 2-17]|uniref:TonB-dependent receptor n=1 Tax=Novosphingobium sp. Rr 2-17 TaxID=555793 RepID=UPI000269A588|nr:TonB-dependent receptor [Novosphingobium sp. Rr 2-17]EIZ77200.1 putative outer membrane salicin receptor [Novosphingobium sp. Rr 2-17]